MPSVRVKRSDYSSLRDRANSEDPRFSIFHWPTSAHSSQEPTSPQVPSTSPGIRSTSPEIRQRSPVTGSASPRSDPFDTFPPQAHRPIGRRRAASRVQDHCVPPPLSRRPRAEDQVSLYSGHGSQQGRSTSSPSAGFVTFEGQNEDVVFRTSSRETGRIGSAISLQEGMPVEVVGDDHHHDDVVEHLDVIGMHLLLTSKTRCDQISYIQTLKSRLSLT